MSHDHPRHPTFDGRPILLGDVVDIADHEEGPKEGATDLVICAIRMVRGVPWLHYEEDGKEVNEIIVAQKGDLRGARYVHAHRPAQT